MCLRLLRLQKVQFYPWKLDEQAHSVIVMSTATDMIAAYLAAETAILQGKDVRFQGRSVTMEDLDSIRKGRQEWEARARAEAQPAGCRGGMGGYAVARFD